MRPEKDLEEKVKYTSAICAEEKSQKFGKKGGWTLWIA